MTERPADIKRREIAEFLALPETVAFLRHQDELDENKDFELAQRLGDADLIRVLRYNEDQMWQRQVVCWGFACGITPETKTEFNRLDFHVDEFGRGYRSRFHDYMPKGSVRHRYACLIGGLIPLSGAEEADNLPAECHVISARYDHAILRLKPGLWIQKQNICPISLGSTAQRIITDIEALTKLESRHAGFYEVPHNFVHRVLSSGAPPDFTAEAVAQIVEIYEGWYGDEKLKSYFSSKDYNRLYCEEIAALGLYDYSRIREFLVKHQIADEAWFDLQRKDAEFLKDWNNLNTAHGLAYSDVRQESDIPFWCGEDSDSINARASWSVTAQEILSRHPHTLRRGFDLYAGGSSRIERTMRAAYAQVGRMILLHYGEAPVDGLLPYFPHGENLGPLLGHKYKGQALQTGLRALPAHLNDVRTIDVFVDWSSYPRLVPREITYYMKHRLT